MTIRALQQYSVEWVKGQHRMGSGTNNQCRWVADGIIGRQVVDALGAILTAHKLELYSLEEILEDTGLPITDLPFCSPLAPLP